MERSWRITRYAAMKGAALQIRSDCNPWQLYDLLQQRSFTLLMEREKNGSYLGKLEPRDIDALKH